MNRTAGVFARIGGAGAAARLRMQAPSVLRGLEFAAKTIDKRSRRKHMKQITYALLAVTLLVLAGVGSAAAQQGQAPPPSKFKLMSSAFSDGGQIPTNISCADPNAASPALSWSNPPAGATSFALV